MLLKLDPAGPLFENEPIEARLDASDANYVDVYHTNAGDIIEFDNIFKSGCFGYNGTIGTVDFWPNGGSHQPGCPHLNSIIDMRNPGKLFK